MCFCLQVITSDTSLSVDGMLTDWSFEETKLDDEHQVAVALAPLESNLRDTNKERYDCCSSLECTNGFLP